MRLFSQQKNLPLIIHPVRSECLKSAENGYKLVFEAVNQRGLNVQFEEEKR